MKVYISGGISNVPDYQEKFESAEKWLKGKGHYVINPAKVGLSLDFLSQPEFMKLSHTLIDLSDYVFMLHGWQNSKGANAELVYAKSICKPIKYQDYFGRNK